MRYIRVLLSVLITASFATNMVYAAEEKQDNSFSEALLNGQFSLNTRVYYFDRSFDKPDVEDAEAFTAGGIMKYESVSFHNFKIGIAPYGSFSLFNIVDRDKGGGTSILQPDGDDIAFLGEAYLDFDTGGNQIRIGRQRLATPLMEDHDIRLLPSVYEAAVYRNKSLADTILEAGYVSRYSGLGSKYSDFESPDAKWGEDGLAYIFAKTKLYNVAMRGQFIATLEDSGTYENYGYLDGNLPINVGHGSYIKGQFGVTGYQEGDTARMYGLKTGTTLFELLDIALLYNKIADNMFKVVEAGPMYSDWQQGYSNYEPSDALGGQLIFRPIEGASIKVAYVDVTSEDGDEFNLDSFSETDLDMQYQIIKAAKIRVRYSIKNQYADSDKESRDDFRIIFYYNF